jgi:hypothetical protein
MVGVKIKRQRPQVTGVAFLLHKRHTKTKIQNKEQRQQFMESPIGPPRVRGNVLNVGVVNYKKPWYAKKKGMPKFHIAHPVVVQKCYCPS